MTHEPKNLPDPTHEDGKMREDQPIPAASEEKVLDETVRMAREGRKQRESESEPEPKEK